MKKALWAASLLLVAGTATACGGDDGNSAPEEASVEEFCKPFKEFDDNTKPDEIVAKLKDVGTPKDIPDDARKGFEFLIDNAEDLEKNSDELTDEQAFKDEYGAEEFGQVEAFFEYYTKTCIGELGDLPPDDVPTDLPTDDLPTDLPTDDLPSLETSIPELPESS